MNDEFKNTDFLDDEEKMRDFTYLTKEEFLASHSYITEDEYDNTYKRYFDWEILNKYGAIEGCIYCDTELEILVACETIRRL